MAGTRIHDQVITLTTGEKVSGKCIRLCSKVLFEVLGGKNGTRTVGTAKVNGFEIPVTRTRGRSRWIQAGSGEKYFADGSFYSSF